MPQFPVTEKSRKSLAMRFVENLNYLAAENKNSFIAVNTYFAMRRNDSMQRAQDPLALFGCSGRSNARQASVEPR